MGDEEGEREWEESLFLFSSAFQAGADYFCSEGSEISSLPPPW